MLADLAGTAELRRSLEHFVGFGVAGVVVTAPAPEPVHVLRRHDVPVVEVDHRPAAATSDGVVRDHEAAARAATGLLLDRGHGPVALVLTDDVRAEAKGYRAVVGPDGRRCSASWIGSRPVRGRRRPWSSRRRRRSAVPSVSPSDPPFDRDLSERGEP